MGNNIPGLTSRLNAEGVAGEEETIRGWEAGARPGPDAVRAMERIFGQPAPDSAPESSAVAEAIDRLTAAVQSQTQALLAREQERDAWLRGLISGLVEQAREREADPTNTPHAVAGQ